MKLKKAPVFASCLLTWCVSSVGTVSFWRGGWLLLDRYLFPPPGGGGEYGTCAGGAVTSAGVSLLLGHSIATALSVGDGRGSRSRSRSRPLSFIAACASVAAWRGVWYIADLYFICDVRAVSALVGAAVGLAYLALTGTVSSSLAPPVCMPRDSDSTFYYGPSPVVADPPPKSGGRQQQCFELCKMNGVSVCVVLAWRGLWILMDLYLFPHDVVLSTWASVAIGLLVAIAACHFTLKSPQPPPSSRPSLARTAECFKMFAALFGCVNCWRGAWFAWDVFAGTGTASCWASYACGLLTLLGCGSLRSAITPPCFMVRDPRDGDGADSSWHVDLIALPPDPWLSLKRTWVGRGRRGAATRPDDNAENETEGALTENSGKKTAVCCSVAVMGGGGGGGGGDDAAIKDLLT